MIQLGKVKNAVEAYKLLNEAEKKEFKRLLGFENPRWLDEALNSGNGSYKP